jgi:hypothetical protein
LTDALLAVLTDPDLRARLGQSGIQWAARFTWERCAEEAWQVARAAIEHSPLPDFAPGATVELEPPRGEGVAPPMTATREGPTARQRSA